jgi:predicted nucleic acid-binding protein
MRVVFDTSVLVAAARSRRGASFALLSRLPDQRFQPAISVALFAEYRAVLLRPENLLARSPAQTEGFLDGLLAASHLQEVFFLWRPALPDPDDDLILELAVAAGCRYIVTHNLRDFRGTERWGVTAMMPGDFLKLIEKET